MRLLLVFLNEPTPGKVNTRLAPDVGDDEAARYYTAMVEVLLRQLQGLQNCRIRFCHAPDDAGDAIRFWLLPRMNASSGPTENIYHAPTHAGETLSQEVDFHPQGEGNLGDRLDRAFSRAFAEGYREVASIGSDCIECGARWINAGFSRLGSESGRDAVIGPTTQGGYYFLALRSRVPELFENIPWRGSGVYAATMSAARRAGLNMDSLPALPAVHDFEDWQHLRASPLGAALKKALGEPGDAGRPYQGK